MVFVVLHIHIKCRAQSFLEDLCKVIIRLLKLKTWGCILFMLSFHPWRVYFQSKALAEWLTSEWQTLTVEEFELPGQVLLV